MNRHPISFFSFGAFCSEPIVSSILKSLRKLEYETLYFGVLEKNSCDSYKQENNLFFSTFSRNAIIRRLIFYIFLVKNKDKFVFTKKVVSYFPGCSVLNLISRNNVLIIPSFSVSPSIFYRKLINLLIQVESFTFKKVILFSSGMQKQLLKKSNIMNLGVNLHTENHALSSQPNFLYIGTLFNRNILDSVIGFKNYHYQGGSGKYHIICKKDVIEFAKIKKYIQSNKLDNVIMLYDGQKVQNKNFFRLCDVGISYIPITKYYDIQPATKTFEYLANGMFVIGTKTEENKRSICKNFGFLIADNSVAFTDACHKYEAFTEQIKLDRNYIATKHSFLLWDNVVKDQFLKLIS